MHNSEFFMVVEEIPKKKQNQMKLWSGQNTRLNLRSAHFPETFSVSIAAEPAKMLP